MYSTESGRWVPEKGCSIEALDGQLTGWINQQGQRFGFSEERAKEIRESLRKISEGIAVADSGMLYAIERYIGYLRQLANNNLLGRSVFFIFADQFYDWEFNEAGVTHLNSLTDPDAGKRYAVLIDMHS